MHCLFLDGNIPEAGTTARTKQLTTVLSHLNTMEQNDSVPTRPLPQSSKALCFPVVETLPLSQGHRHSSTHDWHPSPFSSLSQPAKQYNFLKHTFTLRQSHTTCSPLATPQHLSPHPKQCGFGLPAILPLPISCRLRTSCCLHKCLIFSYLPLKVTVSSVSSTWLIWSRLCQLR